MENQELIKQVTEKAEKWLTPAYDAETQAEVKRMLENPDKTELIDSFYKDLEFGTGGLRGIMGAGTNRMNIYTVGAATQGLSNYLNKCFAGKKDISVVVGHDCRNNSDKFAKISADIFSANGIKVYLFDDLRPTPEVSCADYESGEIKLQEDELTAAAFYSKDNLPEIPRKLSIARRLIDWWMENN